MMTIGPQVAFVEDIRSEIEPIYDVITKKLNTGAVVFDANPESSKYPAEPLESISLLFLDLHYKGPFDAYLCAQWVTKIIASNKRYSLIIWTKDTDKKDALITVLEEVQCLPTYVEAWQKTDYEIESYDFEPKIQELIQNITNETEISELIHGQIIDVEEDGLLVNCIINEDNPTFQVRKFDKELFANIDLQKNGFVKIKILTRPGTRVIEIFEDRADQSERFKATDYFESWKDTAFFNEG